MNTKAISTFILALGLVFSVQLLHGQIAPYGIYNGGPVQTAQPDPSDSIVQLTADAQGLSWLAPDQVPFSGTFWTIVPGSDLGMSIALPYPCPPPGQLPTYALPGGSFLVDDTATTNAVTQAQLQAQATAVVNLVSQGEAAVANAQPHALARATYDGAPLPGGGTGGGTYTPDDLTNNYVVAYGTNLWLEITNISGVWVNLLVSNTFSAIRYEIDATTNLVQPEWLFEGFFIGSELTNWTPTTVKAFTTTSNLFLRVKSWASSDNSGLPNWWELQYFNTTGVNPNALDSAGDGWTIYQKFQLGVSPFSFYTPSAPQDLTAVFNQANNAGTITWLPSRGFVTGYTLEKTDANSGVVQDISLSATAATYSDNLSGDSPDPNNGNVYDVSYRIMASYTNGNTSAWSSSVPLQQLNVSASIIPGTNGTTYLAVSGVPNNATTVQLVFIDQYAEWFYGDASYNYTETIPVSALTNGLYQVPQSWLPGPDGYFDFPDYNIYVQSVSANGNTGGAELFDSGIGWPTAYYNWGTPFYDGREQLKQNLIFQLRAATENGPFQFYYYPNYGYYYYSTNYAYAGLFQYANLYGDPGTFDAFLPFEENYLFRNFVYSQPDVNNQGALTTGIGFDLYYGPTIYLQVSGSPTYLFQTNLLNSPALLATNDSRYLFYDQHSYSDGVYGMGLVDQSDAGSSGTTLAMTNNAVNWFGLPYVTVDVAGQSYYTGDLVTNILAAGNSETSLNFIEPNTVYVETAQPKFQTVEYDFWNSSDSYSASLPGASNFSPTNRGQLLLTTVANSYFQIAGYAKMAVSNAYPGVYGYLGQYFYQAYQADTNGVATTNTTGILSPYGNFFATEPGQEALVTMPDVDTGNQGTCMVYVVSLQLDKNHDGFIDTSFSSPDTTSQTSPMIFWANNNFDRWYYDSDDNTNYMDDVPMNSYAAWGYGGSIPDYNYTNYLSNISGGRAIPTTRDLEDFTRLWVSGVTSNLVASLPTNSTISLSWGDVGSPNPSNPTIDLFVASDADGGIGYLTNTVAASNQISAANGDYGSAYVGRLGPGQNLKLNVTRYMHPGNWLGNHYIWCGVSNGTGGLTLTIADGSGRVLVQTMAYIQIQDIKQMYERWTVGDNLSVAPTNNAVLATEGLPTSIPAFAYPLPTATNTPYILFVHGWNMTSEDKDRFAETAYKRLYWQGYQGRFGSFRWPTGNGFKGWSTIASNPVEKDNFDSSEYNAWRSGAALLHKLNDLNSEYQGHVYLLAHSMGNVVAGEALRLAGDNQVVNAYVASQAAVTAHTYDTSIPNYSFWYPPASASADTPNIYGNWFAGNNGGGAGHVFSFYNTNDFALQRSVWQLNELLKPDQDVLEGLTFWNYAYGGSVNDPAPWNKFFKENSFFPLQSVTFDIVNFITNRYEVMAYAAQPYTTALGATPGILDNIFQNINLTSPQIWLPDMVHPNHPFDEHFYHSAEFRSDYSTQQGYWNELLGIDAFNLK